MAGIEIVAQVVSYAYNRQQEDQKLALLRSIASDAAQIRGLVPVLKDILREAIAENEINDQASNIVNSQDELAEGDYNRAHEYARDAATRLMQDDVKLGASATFLLAAGADMRILKEWARNDPGINADNGVRRALRCSCRRNSPSVDREGL